jgi:hypothetical protein
MGECSCPILFEIEDAQGAHQSFIYGSTQQINCKGTRARRGANNTYTFTLVERLINCVRHYLAPFSIRYPCIERVHIAYIIRPSAYHLLRCSPANSWQSYCQVFRHSVSQVQVIRLEHPWWPALEPNCFEDQTQASGVVSDGRWNLEAKRWDVSIRPIV